MLTIPKPCSPVRLPRSSILHPSTFCPQAFFLSKIPLALLLHICNDPNFPTRSHISSQVPHHPRLYSNLLFSPFSHMFMCFSLPSCFVMYLLPMHLILLSVHACLTVNSPACLSTCLHISLFPYIKARSLHQTVWVCIWVLPDCTNSYQQICDKLNVRMVLVV